MSTMNNQVELCKVILAIDNALEMVNNFRPINNDKLFAELSEIEGPLYDALYAALNLQKQF